MGIHRLGEGQKLDPSKGDVLVVLGPPSYLVEERSSLDFRRDVRHPLR